MNYTAEYLLKQNGVSESLLFIEETLKELRVKKRDLLEALLTPFCFSKYSAV